MLNLSVAAETASAVAAADARRLKNKRKKKKKVVVNKSAKLGSRHNPVSLDSSSDESDVHSPVLSPVDSSSQPQQSVSDQEAIHEDTAIQMWAPIRNYNDQVDDQPIHLIAAADNATVVKVENINKDESELSYKAGSQMLEAKAEALGIMRCVLNSNQEARENSELLHNLNPIRKVDVQDLYRRFGRGTKQLHSHILTLLAVSVREGYPGNDYSHYLKIQFIFFIFI